MTETDQKMHISREELKERQVPLQYRDWCAHLFVEYGDCVQRRSSLPWRCSLEKMAWQKCEFDQQKKREHFYEEKLHS